MEWSSIYGAAGAAKNALDAAIAALRSAGVNETTIKQKVGAVVAQNVTPEVKAAALAEIRKQAAGAKQAAYAGGFQGMLLVGAIGLFFLWWRR